MTMESVKFVTPKQNMEIENKWRVVYIASRQEKKVSKELERNGIEHYLPLTKQLRQWSDRKKWVEVPLFNGYMFVRPDPFQIESILQTTGVVCFLSFEGVHAIVRTKEIEIIRKIESSGYFAESMFKPEDFEIGEKVLVVEGPLKGQQVDVVRKNNERIFLVSFDTLGQSIKVNIPVEVLHKTTAEIKE